MNSICRLKLVSNSTLSHLRLGSRFFIFINRCNTPLVPPASLLKPVIPIQIQSQSFWETFPLTNRSFHFKDGVDTESYELIYRAKLYNYAFYSQLFSIAAFFTQFIYSCNYAFRSFFLNEVIENATHLGPFTLTYDALSLSILIVFSCQYVLLFFVSQRAVLRIYHKADADEYVFITLSPNPFKSQLTYCKPGELNYLNIKNVFALLGNFKLKGKKVFVRDTAFKTPWHYNRLTGYTVE